MATIRHLNAPALALIVALWALLAPSHAFAQPSAPTGASLIAKKGTGTLTTDTFTTQFTKPPQYTVTGTVKGAIVRVYAGDTLIAQGTGKSNTTKLKTLSGLLLPEGSHVLSATQAIDGLESVRAQFLTLIVDRSPPAANGAPDLKPESDTGASNADNITGVTQLVFTGEAEANSVVMLVLNGKPQKKVTTTATGAGGYSLTLPKAKAGAASYAVSQIDAAGNVSPASGALIATVITKPPKAPTALLLAPADTTGGSKTNPQTSNTQPTFTGLAVPGNTVTLLVNGGVEAGSGDAGPDGVWSIKCTIALSPGLHFISAAQNDVVGNESKQSKLVRLTVNNVNGLPLPIDDFNDNARAAFWGTVATDMSAVQPAEVNGRLEFPMTQNLSADHFGAYFGKGWGLDLTRSFRLRVDFRLLAPGIPLGDMGLSVGIVLDGSTTTGGIRDGLLFSVGTDSEGRYQGYEAFLDAQSVNTDFRLREDDAGTLFISYNASQDRFFFSREEFNDPDGLVITGLRRASGKIRAVVTLNGFSSAVAPAISGANAYLDAFQILEGLSLPYELPITAAGLFGLHAPGGEFVSVRGCAGSGAPALLAASSARAASTDDVSEPQDAFDEPAAPGADVNADGSLDSRDVLAMLAAIGASAAEPRCDLDQDGFVTTDDLRALITAMARAGSR